MINSLNFRTLDLNLLRVFDEVMTERNLTRAAHNLAMTQPAVSNALRRLREVVGDDLVRRSGYGVEPTPLALSLWPSVRDALHLLRESLAPGTFDPLNAHNAFVLTMADATAAKLVPGLMDIFETEAPGVNLRVLPLTTRDPRDLLESGSADLAIGHFPGVLAELGALHLQENSPQFLHQRLYDGEYVVVMRKGHPLAGQPLSLDTYCEARQFMRKRAQPFFRIADSDLLEQFDDPGPRVGVDMAWCRCRISAICRSTVCSGLSEVIGSWKIIVMSLPRTLRSASSLTFSRSWPSKNTSPEGWLAAG